MSEGLPSPTLPSMLEPVTTPRGTPVPSPEGFSLAHFTADIRTVGPRVWISFEIFFFKFLMTITNVLSKRFHSDLSFFSDKKGVRWSRTDRVSREGVLSALSSPVKGGTTQRSGVLGKDLILRPPCAPKVTVQSFFPGVEEPRVPSGIRPNRVPRPPTPVLRPPVPVSTDV